MTEVDDQQEANPAKPQDPPSKRMMVLAGGLVLVIAVACSVAAVRYVSSSSASNAADAQAAAKKNARPYTLTPPAGWERVQPTPAGTTVAFTDTVADTDASGTLKAFVTVQSTEMNAAAKAMTFEQVAQAYASELSKSYQNFALKSSNSIQVGDNPAMLATFTFTQSNAEVTLSSLFMVKQGVSYSVNGESLTSAWAGHAGEIIQSQLSFRP